MPTPTRLFVLSEEDTDHPAFSLLRNFGFRLEFCSPVQPLPKSPAAITGLFAHVGDNLSISTLEQFPNLKFILSASSGTDHIDSEYCQQQGINIFSARGSNAKAVAEHVLTLLLLLSRKTLIQIESLKQGRWRNQSALGESLSGKTIGILGVGAIGKEIAYKLQCLEPAAVYGYDPYLTAAEMAQHGVIKTNITHLLELSDFVSVNIPLSKQTKYFISQKELELMKPTSFLISTSRGAVVNESDLIAALTSHSIAGAALDVFEHEPTINQTLLNLPNLITTPHISAFTRQARLQMAREPVIKLLNHLQVIPETQISLSVPT